MRLSTALQLLAPVAALSVALPACASGSANAPRAAAPGAGQDEDPAELAARGREAAARGDSVRAEQYLALAVERGHDRGELLPLLLKLCLSSSRLRAALNHAEPHLREHPGDHALRYLVANIHAGLGQRDAARTELEQLLRQDAGYADAHYLLGVLDSAVEPEDAREHFRRYLELAPEGRRAAEVRSRLSELAIREEAALRLARGPHREVIRSAAEEASP